VWAEEGASEVPKVVKEAIDDIFEVWVIGSGRVLVGSTGPCWFPAPDCVEVVLLVCTRLCENSQGPAGLDWQDQQHYADQARLC
jgi:hypothetical protein